jgi:alpha-L-fucosidase
VTNDRWGAGVTCRHGDFYTCSDGYNPGKLVRHKWENCMHLDIKSWGYRRDMNTGDVITVDEIISSLAKTIR